MVIGTEGVGQEVDQEVVGADVAAGVAVEQVGAIYQGAIEAVVVVVTTNPSILGTIRIHGIIALL